jgi:hypothetical protein
LELRKLQHPVTTFPPKSPLFGDVSGGHFAECIERRFPCSATPDRPHPVPPHPRKQPGAFLQTGLKMWRGFGGIRVNAKLSRQLTALAQFTSHRGAYGIRNRRRAPRLIGSC